MKTNIKIPNLLDSSICTTKKDEKTTNNGCL